MGNEDENGCKDDCDDRIVSGIIVGGGVTVGVAAVANGNVLATVSDVEADRDGIDGETVPVTNIVTWVAKCRGVDRGNILVR